MLAILGTSSICIALSSIPCTTSNPAVLLHHTAAACLTFLACLSALLAGALRAAIGLQSVLRLRAPATEILAAS